MNTQNSGRDYSEFAGLREAGNGKLRAHFKTGAGEEFYVSLLEAEEARAINYNNKALRACSVAIENDQKASDQLDEEDPTCIQASEAADAAIKEKLSFITPEAA